MYSKCLIVLFGQGYRKPVWGIKSMFNVVNETWDFLLANKIMNKLQFNVLCFSF